MGIEFIVFLLLQADFEVMLLTWCQDIKVNRDLIPCYLSVTGPVSHRMCFLKFSCKNVLYVNVSQETGTKSDKKNSLTSNSSCQVLLVTMHQDN